MNLEVFKKSLLKFIEDQEIERVFESLKEVLNMATLAYKGVDDDHYRYKTGSEPYSSKKTSRGKAEIINSLKLIINDLEEGDFDENFLTSIERGKKESKGDPRDWAGFVMLSDQFGSNDNLTLEINPGTAPQEEIAKILAEISLLYRKMGGSGINFIPQFAEVNERELA